MTPVEAASQILALPGPIIFPDTCAIRDLFRSVEDPNLPASLFEGLATIVDQARQNRLWIVTSATVASEFARQVDIAEQDVIAYLKSEREKARRLRRIGVAIPALALGALGRGHTLAPALSEIIEPEKFSRALREVVEALMGVALLVDEDQDCLRRADSRLSLGLRPSSAGGRGFADCKIIENYLEVSRLCAVEPLRRQIFVSSNRKDFCAERTVIWHPDLAQEAETAGLSFASDFSFALSMI